MSPDGHLCRSLADEFTLHHECPFCKMLGVEGDTFRLRLPGAHQVLRDEV